ncbi:hypothetical protein E3P89_03947 [Wallemia ichthyophaga]|uniref:Alpha-MPP n=1 Tax=Wallemia ichthyophaga TaxID=245174 RepID=A0A4T0H0Y6_WALIC|nr:hypothetical protein E3P98_03979 [Wallemia ichthyophaga]TIA94889.1 hypothetical protein E3P95_04000 [Wallemia ichthyophaga]TIA95661.1 hypothetical protein E3P94_03984 [Wallemia ichthyophaga]TIB07195.1 hypothetical protein E3P93_03961 [Wallemia ichthyophaga]TIB07703.1 hypothetical protein E3P90_03960 [Wallemia ichthyophaga]
MELIENYLDDYNSIMETLNHKLDESKSQFGSERRTTLNYVKSELGECEDILSQIGLEMATPQLKQRYAEKHGANSELLRAMRGEVAELIKTSDRHELFGGNSNSDSPYDVHADAHDERGHLLQGVDRVEDGNRRLENSHRIALDTEDVGADILRNLRTQREQIENTHNTLGEADTGIDRSLKTLKNMWRHSIKQKAMTWAIIAVLLRRSAANSAQITTLPNKIRVASDATPGHFNSLGVYMHAGSRFEGAPNTGMSHIVDKLAFNATQTRDAEAVSDEITALGGQFVASSSRETLMYQAAVFRGDTRAAVDILSDTILHPAITPEVLDYQLQSAHWEVKEIESKPDLILPELLHNVAYNYNTLGNPLLCPEEGLEGITTDGVQRYLKEWFKPERMVVAGCGMDHDELVQLTQEYFGGMASSKGPEKDSYTHDSATYTGGDLYLEDASQELTHVYIAFEGVGINDDDVYATAILQMILGGGGSFSAGGPGKGMYSRCYTHVLNYHHAVDFCASFHHCYSDSGLFGVSASVLPAYNHKIVDILCRELYLLTMPSFLGGINQVELARARNQLKSSLIMALESRMVQVEDLGRQVQVNGKRIGVDEMCARIDEVDLDTIRRVALRILKPEKGSLNNGMGSGKPTVVAQGRLRGLKDVRASLASYGM